MKNDCLAAALRELEAAGIRAVERANGGKHLQLRWRVNGGPQRLYVMPLTPGDHRAAANARAGIRRLLREDGVLVDPAKRDAAPAPRVPNQIELIELQARRISALERRLADIERRVTTLEQPKPRRRKKTNEGSQLAYCP